MKYLISAFLSFGLVVMALVFISNSQPAVASVSQGSEYVGTTTMGMSGTMILHASGTGTLGSIVITGANTGLMYVYDATSTEATTSAKLLAQIPANLAAGTYTFDVRYVRGLSVFLSGTAPTSTITWR